MSNTMTSTNKTKTAKTDENDAKEQTKQQKTTAFAISSIQFRPFEALFM
jgi:hypothetical protein